jgi:hypothetical protein
MSVVIKVIHSNSLFWQQAKLHQGLIFLMISILFAPPTLAKSLDEYCVSQIGQTASRLSLIKV